MSPAEISALLPFVSSPPGAVRPGSAHCAGLVPVRVASPQGSPSQMKRKTAPLSEKPRETVNRIQQMGNGGPERNSAVQTSCSTAQDGPRPKLTSQTHSASFWGQKAPFPHLTALRFVPRAELPATNCASFFLGSSAANEKCFFYNVKATAKSNSTVLVCSCLAFTPRN